MKAPVGDDATIDNTSLIVQVLDQGGEGSCELNGWGEAIQSEMWRETGCALPAPELPSRQGLYIAAQIYGGYFGQGDTGTCSYDVAQALAGFGYFPESLYPYNGDPAQLEPGNFLEALKRYGYDQRFESVARVDSDNMSVDDCIARVRQALASGYILPFACDWTERASSLMPGEIWAGPADGSQVLGGHCTSIVGIGPAWAFSKYVSPSKRDTVVARILNSWGTGYGEGGYYLMDVRGLAHRYDIWAATKTPRYSGTV